MKKNVIYAFTLIVTLALAAYCGYVFCTRSAFAALLPYVSALIYVALLALSVVAADFLHEGAHLLLGKCLKMGARIQRISILSSSSVTLEPKGDVHLKARTAVTAAAGITVNLICVIVGVVALFTPLPSELCVLLPYSFYIFAVNAVPLEYSGGKTDGLVLWELLTNAPSAQVMLGVLRVQAIVGAGTPLQNVDEALLLNLPQLPEDDANFTALTQLRLEYYQARGDPEKAEKYRLRLESLKY